MIKAIYSKFGIFFLVLNLTWISGQNFEKLSKEICESISEKDSISQQKLFDEFSKYYDFENKEKELLISDFNPFSFKLQRELIKNCPNLNYLDSYFLLPLSNIADIEQIFNREQLANLEKQLKNIQYKNRLQIFVVTTKDYFPQTNIDDFSYSVLNNNYSDFFEKGAIIFAVNIKERNIRISTNSIAMKNLSDEFCQDILDKIIIPAFKKGKYYEGIENAIKEIETKTKL